MIYIIQPKNRTFNILQIKNYFPILSYTKLLVYDPRSSVVFLLVVRTLHILKKKIVSNSPNFLDIT